MVPRGEEPASSRRVAMQPADCQPEPAAPAQESVAHSQAPTVKRVALQKTVKHDYDWDRRKRWLDKALKIESAGEYSQADVHLLNWFLVGDCGCFTPKTDGRLRFRCVWDCVNNPSQLLRMAASPVYKYCTETLDELGIWEPGVSALIYPQRIRHSVMLCATTKGDVLSRSRRTGQFTKMGPGGGEEAKSCMHNHFACRHGIHDEYGIGFNNTAVLDISPPILSISEPHPVEKALGEKVTVVWIQYCLLDADQIVKVGEPDCGTQLTKPDTPGRWGKYEVGGERLQCPELARSRGDRGISFCFEPLRHIR